MMKGVVVNSHICPIEVVYLYVLCCCYHSQLLLLLTIYNSITVQQSVLYSSIIIIIVEECVLCEEQVFNSKPSLLAVAP